MIAGKVVGSVISTRKCENLVGNKFMIVDVLDHMQTSGKQLIAIDKIEAAAANGIKEPVCYTVIPSPHEEIIKLINKSVNRIR